MFNWLRNFFVVDIDQEQMFGFGSVIVYNDWVLNFQNPATPIAERIIDIHNYVFFFLVFVLIFVAWMLYRILYSFWFIIPDNIKYNGKDYKVLQYLIRIKLTHHAKIEVIWTILPSLILIAIAIPSFGLLYAMDDVIDPDMTIKVIGHQWYWSYEYSDLDKNFDFKSTISFDSYMLPEDELTIGDSRLLEVDNSIILPIGGYIRVNVTSSDVLHCWAVPSLGIKIDAVPHRINTGLIYLQRTGVFYGQCSEICGVNHGFMPIVVNGYEIDNFLLKLKELAQPVINELIEEEKFDESALTISEDRAWEIFFQHYRLLASRLDKSYLFENEEDLAYAEWFFLTLEDKE